GFDVQHQLVQVGTLFHTGAFDRVADTAHRAVRRIEENTADGVSAVVGQGAHVAGHIATALFHLDLHFQLAGISQGRDHVIGIDDLDVVRQLDVAGQHHALGLLAQYPRDLFATAQLDHDAVQVQQHVDAVFTHAGDGRVP